MKSPQILGLALALLVAAFVSVALARNAQHRTSMHRTRPAPASDKTAKPEGSAMTKNENERIIKTDAEWKQLLTPDQYRVLRARGTEIAFTGKYWNQHAKGTYRCAACGYELFSSEQKFDSGTGWPSFWQPVAPENVVETVDGSLMVVRTAVSCRLCDAHLGHVFDDGPAPTGLRYCMNSLAMRFVKLG